MPIDHYDAQDRAELIAVAPAARNFISTGKITPGFRAAVDLYNTGSDIQELADYVADRVSKNELDTPKDWPS